jgi:sterol desaturase/sphingolipid hydroxylase (fatty acid hydroxylase superfamily)
LKASLHTIAVVAALFVLFFAVERLFPLRESRRGLVARLLVNGLISALAFVVAAIAVRPAAMQAMHWADDQPFGLLHLVPLPGWGKFVVGFLLLDLSFYYWHVANHRFPLLWRFHNVHHMDPDLDVSTGFRFHFGEVLFSTVFRVLQVSLIGVGFATFAAFEVVFQANTLFHHSNLRLPIRLERLLNKLLVTPRMHGIHHSQVKEETNSNFGVIFPWWDRLHRTLGLNVPQSAIEIGVPAYSSPADNSLRSTLVMPFVAQRDYWLRPDGRRPARVPETAEPNPRAMAE